jgi:hypothetical protein
LQVWGGAGIGGDLYIGGRFVTTGSGGSITGASLIASTAAAFSGTATITSTATSTSTTTGALIVSGGGGIGGD